MKRSSETCSKWLLIGCVIVLVHAVYMCIGIESVLHRHSVPDGSHFQQVILRMRSPAHLAVLTALIGVWAAMTKRGAIIYLFMIGTLILEVAALTSLSQISELETQRCVRITSARVDAVTTDELTMKRDGDVVTIQQQQQSGVVYRAADLQARNDCSADGTAGTLRAMTFVGCFCLALMCCARATLIAKVREEEDSAIIITDADAAMALSQMVVIGLPSGKTVCTVDDDDEASALVQRV